MKDEEHCWLKAIVKELREEHPKRFILKCQMDDSNCGSFEIREIEYSETESPFLRNTTLNEDRLDDLTNLSHLNDPAVLNTIHCRYQDNIIYTYSGLVLVSLNPYCDLGLYGDSLIQAYSGKSRGELEPHLFAVAEDAFRSMQRDQRNQSIIISGESGAGKTISARYVMRYFASAANAHLSKDSTTIESRVLASNPILEAFGNAKTTRNDNSSRFGKYVQIFFDRNDEITGAAIKTYLLEKTRVVKQSPGERNYHVFYQLIEGSTNEMKKELFLDSVTWKDFEYLKAAGGLIENVNDSKEFEETVKSMKIAGFPENIQLKIFKILAAILHLGNLTFQSDEENYAILAENDVNLMKFAQLLNATEKAEELARWFTSKQLITKLESVEIKLNVKQAEAARDAVAKFLYSKVFEFIVKKLNELLEPTEKGANNSKFIGVLDIYGFEKFDQNSFEQFCINYANEKLQHEFNQQVFKLEQELYEREQIEWSFINFSDNQPCIDLIEIRGGLLDLLDEECRFPNGGDQSFLDKIKAEIPKNGSDISGYLGKDPLELPTTFTIKHFAYDVAYSVDGFLEKNRDLVPSEIIRILEDSESEFISKNSTLSRTSTGSAFRESLRDLMKIIQITQVHYIRCIKPNNFKATMTFEPNFVMQQLRAGGIIETIKISAAGYPARWSFEEFFSRYRLLNVRIENAVSSDYRELSTELLKGQVDYLRDGEYQVGKTQIFLRAGILAKLEKIRSQTLKTAASLIQSQFRGFWATNDVKKQFQQIILIQSAFKMKRAFERVKALQRNQAANLLQTAFKYHVTRNDVKQQIEAIMMIQIQLKSRFRREFYAEERRNRMVLKIQFVYRAKKEILIKNLKNYSAKQIQNSFKFHLARKELKQLRTEAKSFEKLQETSLGLEKKVIEITKELEMFNVKNQDELKAKDSDIKELANQIESRDQRIIDLEKEIDGFKSQVSDLEGKIQQTERENIRSIAEMKSLQVEELRQLKSLHESQLATISHSNDSFQLKYKELLESKEKLEVKFAKVEQYVRTLMANHVISKVQDVDHEELEVDLMGSQNSLMNFISEDEDTKLIKFTSSNGVLEDLLRSESILEELMLMIRTASVPEEENDSNPGFLIDTMQLLKPARIIYSWLAICLTLPQLTILTENRMNFILENIRVTLSESTDDKKCSLWLTNLIQLYGMIHHFILEKEAEVYQNHSKIKGEGREDRKANNISGSVIKGGDKSGFKGVCDTTAVNTTIEPANCMEVSPSLTATTQISISELPPAIILLARAEVMRLIGDIYSAWLKELCRWFAKAGVSGILEHQPLPNYKVKSAVMKERKTFVETITTLINDKVTEDVPPQSFSINELLDAFDDLLEAFMRTTLDLEIVQSILIVIYRHMSIVCFNQLLLKRNFISWKRAIQIQFNLSRLEDWCRERLGAFGIDQDAIDSFGPLLQAVKVIQLAKTRGVDTGVLQQCAPDLSPLQIRKLLTNYVPDDFEDGPVPLSLIRQFPAGTTNNSTANSTLLPQLDLNKLALPVALKERSPPIVTGIESELPIDMPPTLWKLFVLYLK